MPQKTKIIFITVFLLVGAIMLGIYFYNKSRGVTTDPNATIYQKFNPFGTSTKNPTTTSPGTSTVTEEPTTVTVNGQTSRFHKLTDFAVSGATFFEEIKTLPQTETQPVIETTTATKNTLNKLKTVEPTYKVIPSLRFVEKATGHIYQMTISNRMQGKISNSTIPGVYETIFNNNADSIIYRYPSSDNKSITSFLSFIGGKSSSFLAPDIIAVSLSPDKNNFFTLTKNKSGVIGVTSSFDQTKSSKIFSSSFSEWLPQWVTEKSIYLTTKPSYLVEGSIFSLDIKNGTLYKIFGGVNGLTTLANNTGEGILFGASLNIGPKLNIFNTKDHTSFDLKTYGLPEKCVWSNDNINVYCAAPNKITGTQYPDFWYQGLVSFDDMFVKINTLTFEKSTLANSINETPVDAVNMFLDKQENSLFFINKKDGTLWQLDL